MGFRKYQAVEKQEVLTPEEHQTVGNELHKVGKTTMRDLDANQRQQVTEALDDERQ